MSKYSKIAPKDIDKLKSYLGSLYKHVAKNDEVLDFGCSTGYFGELLIKDKGCLVNGVEIDPGDLLKARQVLGKVYSFDLDGEWPSEVHEKRYDVLLFGDVIEHLKFPEEVLKKSKLLLKDGGRILISTPNIAHISTRLELLAGDFNYESTGILDNTHLRLFTLDTLKKLAVDTGYKITDIDYSLVDFSPTVVRRLLSKLGLTPSDKFWSIMESPQARAYQYKIVLEPLAKGEKPKPLKVPSKPISEHDKVYLEMKDRIDKRDQSLVLLTARLDEINAHYEALAREMAAIHNSKSWKIARAIRSPRLVAKRIRKIIK